MLFQAGSSPLGMDFGAEYADAIYTAQPHKEGAIAFRNEIGRLAASHGRPRNAVRVLPGIVPIVGETDADAEEFAQTLADHIDYEAGSARLAAYLDVSFAGIGIDEVVPADRWPDDSSRHSRYHIFRQLATEEGLTIRQLVAEDYKSQAHLSAVGSASRVADLLVDWFESGAADGFSLNPPSMPEGLRRVCELLVPELQDRGYFREEYEGTTLREHLGLERPGAWDA